MTDWKALHKRAREQRAKSRVLLTQALVDSGVRFESLDFGIKLKVENKLYFWPGTGAWVVLGSSQRGKGVDTLVEILKELK